MISLWESGYNWILSNPNTRHSLWVSSRAGSFGFQPGGERERESSLLLAMASSCAGAVLLLLMFTLCVDAAVDTVYHSHTSDRDLAERKVQCYKDIDSGLWGDACKSSPIDKENCALSCVSASCYDSVYGNDPLEDGEIDLRRGRQFKACIRGQAKVENMARVRASIT